MLYATKPIFMVSAYLRSSSWSDISPRSGIACAFYEDELTAGRLGENFLNEVDRRVTKGRKI
jgi:hypothetical protein